MKFGFFLCSDKLYQISGEAVCAVAGYTADANVLINEIRLAAERYRFQYGSSMPLEQLVIHVCNIKQYYGLDANKMVVKTQNLILSLIFIQI